MQVRRAVDALEVKRLVEHGRLDHCRGAAAVLQARARVPSPGASRVRAGPSLLLCGNLLHVVGHRVRAARLCSWGGERSCFGSERRTGITPITWVRTMTRGQNHYSGSEP
eukprot:scaffold6371_cov110-Isochrysis_galbana.AAC.2